MVVKLEHHLFHKFYSRRHVKFSLIPSAVECQLTSSFSWTSDLKILRCRTEMVRPQTDLVYHFHTIYNHILVWVCYVRFPPALYLFFTILKPWNFNLPPQPGARLAVMVGRCVALYTLLVGYTRCQGSISLLSLPTVTCSPLNDANITKTLNIM